MCYDSHMELCAAIIIFITGVGIGIAIRQRIYWFLKDKFNIRLPKL